MSAHPWRYENLLMLDHHYRQIAQQLIQTRLPNYSSEHSAKLCGGAPNEYYSRCVMEGDALIGVMAFSVGKLDTVEIVGFVSAKDKGGIGRFLMEEFLKEVSQKRKSSILTYVEPLAQDFFAKFGFTKSIPARSLYEKIINKYVSARLMYCNLLRRVEETDEEFGEVRNRIKSLDVGDRLLVLVDGTMNVRQALVQEIDRDEGTVFVHYFFWNHRHDEWIYLHSPRICWDIPLPPDPPKNKGENCVTTTEVKSVNAKEFETEKKLSLIQSLGAWPIEFKIKAQVQVKVEGNWVDAVVVGKTKEFCYCKFSYQDNEWFQDFPRDSIRVGEKTAFDVLVEKNAHARVKKAPKPIKDTLKPAPVVKPRKQKIKLTIEISPIKKEEKLGTLIQSSEGGAVSGRTMRKRKREELVLSPDGLTTASSSISYSNGPCCVCEVDIDNFNNGDEQSTSSVTCESCKASVHLSCYMLENKHINPQKWHCDLCTHALLSPKSKSSKCVFCSKSHLDGGIMTQTLAYKWIHVKCARSIALEFHPRERRFANFRLASPTCRKRTCSVCDSDHGVTIKCLSDACHEHAHVACAKSNWTVTVNDEDCAVEFFCPLHKDENSTRDAT